ncbi:MAG: DUF58 domain-containing protein [Myxococcota bacterium]
MTQTQAEALHTSASAPAGAPATAAPSALPARRKRTFGQLVGRVRDYFPLTTLGVVLAAIGAVGYFVVAENTADFIVMAISLVLLALVGVSLFFVLVFWPIFAAVVRKRPSGLPESLTVGIPYQTAFLCPRLPWVPLVQVGLDWDEPDAVDVETRADGSAWVETVTPRERGRFESIVRRFTLRDVFGFAEVRFTRRWVSPLRIQPVPGRADLTLAIRRATDDGYSHPSGQPLGELVEMRRYAHGDPVRHILWKVYARSRRLMVREPERAIAPKPAMVGFFVAGRGDEASASTARLFLEQGLLGHDFVFAAEGAARPTSKVGEAIEQVIESRAFRDSGADSLAPLLRSVDRGRLDNLVVFAPGADGVWVEKLVAASRRLPMPPMVVMTIDGQIEAKKGSRLSRLLFAPKDDVANRRALREVPVIHDRLRQAGMELRVIHRASGARLDQVSMDAWRALS